MSEFSRKVVVSGASSGIGLATVERLLASECEVVGISRRKPAINHDRFYWFECDLQQISSLPERMRKLQAHHAGYDALICAAGAGRFGSLEEFSYQQIADLIELNLTSQIIITRALLSGLKSQHRSDIVFIGSEAGLAGHAMGAVYCATKFGLRGFAQSIRAEGAKQNMHVSIINPGMVDTPFFDSLGFAPGDAKANSLAAIDVADAVMLALKSPDNAVIEEINLQPLIRKVAKKSNPDR